MDVVVYLLVLAIEVYSYSIYVDCLCFNDGYY
jgi:hypothetical protein